MIVDPRHSRCAGIRQPSHLYGGGAIGEDFDSRAARESTNFNKHVDSSFTNSLGDGTQVRASTVEKGVRWREHLAELLCDGVALLQKRENVDVKPLSRQITDQRTKKVSAGVLAKVVRNDAKSRPRAR